jgi:hypothetical protein
MKQVQNSMEIHKGYLEMFDICPLCKRQHYTRITDVYAATVTARPWLWPLKFVPGGTVALEVGIPDLSHISVCKSRV